MEIYVSKIENRATFKITNGYYLELLTPKTMKLLGSTESKITGEKNGENVPHLILCYIVNNNYQQNSPQNFTLKLYLFKNN